MSYAAAYGGHDRTSTERQLRRDHPLGLRKTFPDPADDEPTGGRRWSFGVAAGALLVAGTFAAGALGLNGGEAPLVTGAPEHAPAAPGSGNSGGPDIGGAAVAAPPQDEVRTPTTPATDQVRPGTPASTATDQADPTRPAPPANNGAAHAADGAGADAAGGTDTGAHRPTPRPVPAPRPAEPAAPEQDRGLVDQVVTPVTDTVGGIVDPVTDTVDDLLSPVTGVLSTGGGDQPALTMIDPLGDLIGH